VQLELKSGKKGEDEEEPGEEDKRTKEKRAYGSLV
jgi:hypothetical protein